MTIRKFFGFCVLLLTILACQDAVAAKQTWSQFVQEVRAEALSQGIRPEIFDAAFADISEPHRKVLNLDRTQPEKRLTYLQYRNTRADPFRIKLGRQEMSRNAAVLEKIGNEYGVSPCFIVSLWGMETSYGRYMGTFPVIKSLATLAYDNRRAAFFRKQLLLALHILNGGHVNLEKFKGEWAGASGHPQFMPSSWDTYAVDYEHNGKKDIWTSLPDSFASIANYLVKNGWKRDEPWAIPVSTPTQFNEALMTRETKKTVNEWQQMGVVPAAGYHLPSGSLTASIVRPDGGPTFMIFNNFNVLMKWNHSIYYVGTIGYMAEQICRRKL